MLIEHKSINSLDAATRSRLIACAASLLKSREARHGVVIFEGHCISAKELQSFIPPQILTED